MGSRDLIDSAETAFDEGGRAGEGTRTLDINLGKVALYQLSYTRRVERKLVMGLACVKMVFLLTVVLGARRGWEYWD